MRNLRWWFWIESATALLTTVVGLVTLLWHDWIELVLGVDPDHGNGSIEVWFVVAMFSVSACCGAITFRMLRAAIQG
ncbi:MAG: ABC transporter permease [Acidimicrobiales bacterium]